MSAQVAGKRYIPAVKNTRTGIAYPRQFGEEIHRCIYHRVEKELGLNPNEYGVIDIYRRMEKRGFVPGYVSINTLDFFTRQDMERLYDEGESYCLTRRGIVLDYAEQSRVLA